MEWGYEFGKVGGLRVNGLKEGEGGRVVMGVMKLNGGKVGDLNLGECIGKIVKVEEGVVVVRGGRGRGK